MSPARVGASVAVALVALILLAACDGSPSPAERPDPAPRETVAGSSAPADRGDRPPPPAPEPGVVLRGTVARVVDGDTVQVRVRGFDTVVRLIGIDTPETRHPSRPVECWGPEATARARALMPVGARVRLEADPSQDVRDRYGRLLAHVYTGHRTGAASVNRALVASGAARVYVYGSVPFRYVDAFRRAERAARAAGRGLWGPPCRGVTRAPAPAPATAPSGAPAGARCDPNYTGACVPPYPPDVDCADVGRPVTVVGADPHNFDSDGNGRGCERY
jgi:micrococcal nuclease